MGQIVNLKNASIQRMKALTCNECGSQNWVNLYDENGWIVVLCCAGKKKDGTRCECVVDLDEIIWADEEE